MIVIKYHELNKMHQKDYLIHNIGKVVKMHKWPKWSGWNTDFEASCCSDLSEIHPLVVEGEIKLLFAAHFLTEKQYSAMQYHSYRVALIAQVHCNCKVRTLGCVHLHEFEDKYYSNDNGLPSITGTPCW